MLSISTIAINSISTKTTIALAFCFKRVVDACGIPMTRFKSTWCLKIIRPLSNKFLCLILNED